MILRKLLMLVFIGVAVCVLSTVVGAAAVITVDDSGGAMYTSIQAAIDVASPGDEIHVDSGTYYENVVVNKQLILRGIDTGTGMPVVDAGGSGSAITLSTDGITLEGFNATNSSNAWFENAEIWVTSNYNTILGNTANNNYNVGIFLYSSNNNDLIRNTVTNTDRVCIYLYRSSNNNLTSNTVTHSTNGIMIYDSSNNNNLTDNKANNNHRGLHVYESNNNILTGNNADKNVRGIVLLGSIYNTLQSNTANNNTRNGIEICYSTRINNILISNNTLINNIANNNSWHGIYLRETRGNIILTGNTANNNKLSGIELGSAGSNNVLNDNIANNNEKYGIFIQYSSNNLLYKNDLINNAINDACDTNGNNQWDSGTIGNYYSDYTGTDSDGDGIGDTPYPIPDGSSVDNYPLMVPYSPPPSDYEGKLLKQTGDFKVYLIEDGKKRHFTSPEALEWNGHSFDDVIEVSVDVINSFELGADINITEVIINKYNDLGGETTFGPPAGTGEQTGYPDSSGVVCSYVNFQNGAIEYFTNGDQAGNAYAILNPFFDKWASMGYGKSVLGYPISDMSDSHTSSFGTPFKYQNFINGTERGALEYNLSSGEVFEIHGAIYATWSAMDYANSILGLVTSDERDAVPSFKDTTGRVSDFENGHLHWHSSGDHYMVTYMTYGELDELYVSMSGTDSWLGFPVMHQEDRGGYGYCEFEGGYIEWDVANGKYEAFEYTTPDITPPTIIINTPNDGEVIDQPKVIVSGVAFDESGIYLVTVNGINAAENSGLWSAEILLLEEENIIEVIAVDNYLNQAVETITITHVLPKPEIEVEIQSNGVKDTSAEMGKRYDLVVKLTNIDEHAHYYSLGMDQVGHDIPWKDWDPKLNLESSNIITQLIEPGETKEYRFPFINKWKWLDDTKSIDAVSGQFADAGAVLIEDPTIDLLLVIQDIVDTIMMTYPATGPIRTVDIYFEPNPKSTHSITGIDELKKSVTVEIPYTDVKVSSFAMSIIWTWSGNAATAGWDILTGGPILDFDYNVAKKLGKYIIGSIATIDSEMAYQIAVDPNNDFEIVVEPEPIYLPEIDLIKDNHEKELVSLYLELSSIHRAFEKSYIRYAGASEADEPYYMVLQLEAAKEYSIQLARKMEEIQRLHKTLFNDFEYMSEDQIIAIQNYVSLNGLNQIEVDFLTREGHEELIQFRIQRIINADPIMYTDPSKMHTLLSLTTQSFIMNSEELMKEIIIIKLNQLDYSELTATPQEINELENLKISIQNGLNDGNSYEELNFQIQLMIKKSNELIERTNNITYLEYYTFATKSLIDNINTFEPYNITFLPPITTMDQFNLTDGSTLPIKFTARDNDTGEFIYDDTVNVTITNSTGHLITYFTNGTGTGSVRINSEEEQYIANFHTKDYAINIGEIYSVTVTFGEPDGLRGYDITYFTLIEGGKAKGKSN